MSSKRRQITYQLLRMPDPAAGLPDGWTEVGTFRPGDHQAVVEALSGRRVRGIMRLLSMPGLFSESWALLNDNLFHTYPDFLVSLRHDQPTRKDGISYGHALDRFTPDLSGYLAYLKEKAPGLARFLETPLPFCIRNTERKRHTLIVAASGAGKSVLMNTLIHSDRAAADPPTTILIDPHGDLAEDVAQSRLLKGRADLVYLDPFLAPSGARRRSFTVNFFDVRPSTPAEIRDARLSDEKIDRLAQVGSGILEMVAGGEGSLTLNMRTLLYPCLCVLLDIRAGERPYSIADLARFMDDSKNEDLVERGMRSRFPAHRVFFEAGEGGESGFHARSFRTTKMALYTRIQSLLNSQLFCDLAIGDGYSTIDLETEIDSRRAILFNICKNKLGEEVAVTFGKFLVGLIMAHCMGRPQGKRTPVELYLDEFHNFVSPSIKAAFTELRKFGLHLTIAQQYEGQEGNRDIAKAIANNTNVKMIGRTSDPGSAIRMAAKVLVEETAVRRLQIGEFFVRAEGGHSFRVTVPDTLLRPEYRLSQLGWARFRAQQLERHHRPVRSPERHAKAARGGERASTAAAPDVPPRTAEDYPADKRPHAGAPRKRRPKFRLPGQP